MQLSFAQEKTISGTISDEMGMPMPEVNILIKGTTSGARTDFDGNYSISANAGDVLTYSFVGYKTIEKTVGDAENISFQMEISAQAIDEVVVTALGIAKEKNKLGYSAQTVDTDKLTNSGESSMVNALNGKVAGVNITSASGSPGASTNIVIRGSSSILGNNQPLFVIDGIPIDNTTDSGNATGAVDGTGTGDYGQVVGSNRAADINPEDIASMTVLKGGAATALYGIRAVNGAVIITTKRGSRNQKGLNINLSAGTSFDQVNKYPEFTDKFARGRNGLYSNVTHWSWGPAYASNPVFPSDDPSTTPNEDTYVDLNGDGEPENVSGETIPFYADNYKRFWQTGSKKNYNFSVSGGNDKGTFYTSTGYTDHEGIVQNDTYKRLNLILKGNYDITDKFKVGGSASYSNVKTNAFQGSGSGYGSGLTYWHHMWDIKRPWKDSKSKKTWFSDFVADPSWIINEEGENGNVNRLIGNVNFSYKISDWMRLNYRAGLDTYSDEKKLVRPISSVNTASIGWVGDMYEVRINNNDLTSNINLTGNFDISEKSKIGYLIGNDLYNKRYDRLFVQGQTLLIKDFFDISSAKDVISTNSDNNKRIVGLFGELNYDFNNILFLSVTGRNDWSSTLPKKNNSFFYPSVSGAFTFSELLDKEGGILNFGKLKGSWAKLGNDAPPNSLRTVYIRKTPNVIGEPIFTISRTENNPNLVAELSSSWEAGTELQFFDNLIGVDFTYYDRRTIDQIVPIPLTSTTGFTKYIDNSGEVRNSGIETVLSFNNILRKSESLNWNLLFNFTKNNSEVLEVPETVEEIVVGNGAWNATKLVARPGLPYGTFVGNAYKKNDKGQLLLDDKGRPQWIANQVLGNINPDYILSINNGLKYKNLNFSANLEIRQGGTVFNDAEMAWIYAGLSKTTEDRFYSEDTPGANATKVFDGIIESTGERSNIAVPLDNTYYQNNYNQVDENFAEDASWVRLRSVSLSYDLPKKFIKNTFLNNLSLTLTGRNLWLSTKYKGIDPETSGLGAGNVQGFNTISAPGTKSYGLMVRLNF